MTKSDDTDPIVKVRSQLHDWRVASYRCSDISGWHWDTRRGGIAAPAAPPLLYAYVWCHRALAGELVHSCTPSETPHRITVCVLRNDNEHTWNKVAALAGLAALAQRARAAGTLAAVE
jgi:hypothetical protein